MKKSFLIIVASVICLVVMVAFFIKPILDPVLGLILHWGIILGSIAGLVGIINLITTHITRVRFKEKRFFFSIIVLLGFTISFLGGMILGSQNEVYIKWLAAFQVPLEVSLMALLALTMTYAGVNFFRLRGWTILSISFGLSAIVFMVLSLGFLQGYNDPVVDRVILFVNSLPIAGGRGILIGISLGALLTGLRVLTGSEKPYGD
ncbi:MAG: hypothetical protein MUO40_10540 [Anaerolineaceae bacterium]|nr:hypothetical protein [Anaerolineaceae bacterium]